jgi:septal ring factor EnvC (AmiA/AmiB activator)
VPSRFILEVVPAGFYVPAMKRICAVQLAAAAIFFAAGPLPARAQDSALEQRINELGGRIETLLEAQEAQGKRLAELTREINAIREQVNKPPPPQGASQEDLKRLADSVREVDRKRLDDYEKIRTELQKLGRMLKESTPAVPKNSTPPRESRAAEEKPSTPETGYEHEVQKSETLSTILQAYREKGVKVSLDQVLKANPGLKPERIRVGQKIFIPVPAK